MKELLTKKPTGAHAQFICYFCVGGTSAVVDLTTYSVSVALLAMHYLPAAIIGYTAGLIWNHWLSVVWVFERKHHVAKEVLMVIAIAVVAMLLTWLILYIGIDVFGMGAITAKLASQIIVLAWNFGARKMFVFH